MTDWYKIKRILTWQNWVEKQIYPAGWKPWSNTIAYYPLTSTTTVNDLSWNWYNLTNTSTTFWTYQWVSCASFNWSTSKLTATIWTLPQWANPRTTSLWIYNTGVDWLSIMWYWANRTRYWCWEYTYGSSTEWYTLAAYYIDEFTHINTKNSWLLFTATYDWTYIKTYINWEIKSTSSAYTLATSWTNFEIWSPYATNPFQGYASNAIIENKVRTAQEISDYYNLTKSNYGL